MSINRIGFSFKCLLSDWLYILLLTFFVAFCVLKYDTTIFCALNNELLSISLPSLTNELKLKHLRIKQLKCVVFKLYLFQLISTFIIVFFSQNINLEWETFVWIKKKYRCYLIWELKKCWEYYKTTTIHNSASLNLSRIISVYLPAVTHIPTFQNARKMMSCRCLPGRVDSAKNPHLYYWWVLLWVKWVFHYDSWSSKWQNKVWDFLWYIIGGNENNKPMIPISVECSPLLKMSTKQEWIAG